MGESFTIQLSNNLVRSLLDDGEKLRKKTKKSKSKILQEPKNSHQKQISNDPEEFKSLRSAAGWPLQPPVYLPTAPSKSENAELDSIKSLLQDSQNVVERLQKREENMLQEVTQRAKALHDEEFKLPSRQPMPCLNEKDECLKCYKEHAKDPLKCANLVKEFADCARRVRRQVNSAQS
ncbi:hypothetical protein F511_12257 [Dorcoceras hygrometricum]|uniref:Uncharacterized protein n=1 Tax=Dorcoceras hygrometricum TaxID=472368 RepID=A0A2Z7A4G2_9LAMI|nr:hypothetical protein F511_12257 [Dorcoceras hygrometricum]